MKNFLIFCSVILTIVIFFPFVNSNNLIDIFSNLSELISQKGEIPVSSTLWLYFLLFLLGSWFLTLGYNKKVKISIIGIVGMLIYFFFFTKIIIFLGEGDSFLRDLGGEFGYNMLGHTLGFKDIDKLQLFFLFLDYFSKDWSFGIYVLIFAFAGNSISILNILRNIILHGLPINYIQKGNEKNEGDKENIEIIEVKKEKPHNILKLGMFKLIGLFIIGNILGLIVGIFIWSELIYLVTMRGPMIHMGEILGGLAIFVFINLYIVNNFVYPFISRKKINYITIGVFIALYIWVLIYNYTQGIPTSF